MGVVVHRGLVHDGLELVRCCLVTGGPEVRAPERLADRALLGLQLAGLLERDRGGGEIAVLQQVAAAHVEVVDAIAVGFVARHARASVRARSSSTASTIAPATADFGPRGTR